MAKRKQPPPPLPKPGTAYAVPQADGRYGACRVIRTGTAREIKAWGAPVVLVACSPWIGKALPKLKDKALRQILHLEHHFWSNDRQVFWVSEPAPDSFIPIGVIAPTAKDKQLTSNSLGDWCTCELQPLKQWRWDHEREAVLAEDALEEEHTDKKYQQAREARAKFLSSLTLKKLSTYDFFTRWKSYPPKPAIRASKQIMQRTVKQLAKLGKRAPEIERMKVLQKCIESFNHIDEEMNHFIETVERDDICDEFELLVHACGLGKHQNLADQWRDW